jgi:WD40 repeat protein
LTGDERGKLFFYDWKTSKSYRVLDGHGGTSIGLEWHPSHPTRVLSVGWEGMVKLWE